MDFDAFFKSALAKAISSNPQILEDLGRITKDHHERLASSSQGKPYFKVGEKVGLKFTWSLGEIQEIRATENSYEYLVAWLNFDNSPTGEQEWIEQNALTL